MDNYTTNQPRTGRENERPTSLETLGGEFGLSWNDTVPLTPGAHNAFLSAFFEAGRVFDHLVDTCPLRLTSNNAPTNCETLGTAIVGMTNGSYRYRHFDNLSGDAVTAELFGVRRLMSCDSVRRNLKAIPWTSIRGLSRSSAGTAATFARAAGVGLPEREMHLRRSRQVPGRAKRGALRSKVARGCARTRRAARGRARTSSTR